LLKQMQDNFEKAMALLQNVTTAFATTVNDIKEGGRRKQKGGLPRGTDPDYVVITNKYNEAKQQYEMAMHLLREFNNALNSAKVELYKKINIICPTPGGRRIIKGGGEKETAASLQTVIGAIVSTELPFGTVAPFAKKILDSLGVVTALLNISSDSDDVEKKMTEIYINQKLVDIQEIKKNMTSTFTIDVLKKTRDWMKNNREEYASDKKGKLFGMPFQDLQNKQLELIDNFGEGIRLPGLCKESTTNTPKIIDCSITPLQRNYEELLVTLYLLVGTNDTTEYPIKKFEDMVNLFKPYDKTYNLHSLFDRLHEYAQMLANAASDKNLGRTVINLWGIGKSGKSEYDEWKTGGKKYLEFIIYTNDNTAQTVEKVVHAMRAKAAKTVPSTEKAAPPAAAPPSAAAAPAALPETPPSAAIPPPAASTPGGELATFVILVPKVDPTGGGGRRKSSSKKNLKPSRHSTTPKSKK